MLCIKDLNVSIDGKPVLKRFHLQVNSGEIHALMGPNGAGKSTLAKVLAGHPAYEVTAGEITFLGQNILDLDPEERAALGVFMGFQYPVEVPGLSNLQFLQAAYNAVRQTKLSEEEFSKILDTKLEMLGMRDEFKTRHLNDGFSGGEKKRNEILQMAVLEPKLTVLDEIDSGLDIDAMRIVASGVAQLHTPEKALILITHYQRFLDYVKPHFVHVVVDGAIVQSGGPELALHLEEQGYAKL
jgi:Fe-S cluster assembly ATP-binding protein